MKHRITAAAAALLLVSCSGQNGAGNGSANAAGGNEAAAGADAAPEAGSAAAPAAAMAQLSPGQWETRVEVLRLNMSDVPNMPAGVTPPMPPPTTVRSCLTPEQARQPNAGFLTGGENQSGCTYEDFSMTGGRMQGIVTCTREGTTVRATVNGSFTADSYAMESESRVTANGMTVETASRVTSRRIGDCPAG